MIVESIENKKSAYCFTPNMREEEVIIRLLCAISRVPLEKLEDCRIDEQQWVAICKAYAELLTSRLCIIDMNPLRPETVDYFVSQDENVDLVFIDYLQAMIADKPYSWIPYIHHSRYAAHRLKRIAEKNDIQIVTFCLLNDRYTETIKKDNNHRPDLHDFYFDVDDDDFDVICFLERLDNKIDIYVEKNQFGYTAGYEYEICK